MPFYQLLMSINKISPKFILYYIMSIIVAERNDSNIIQASNNGQGNITMNQHGYLNVELKSINGESIDTGSGVNSDGTQRICIANDDTQLTNMQKYIVDGRMNPNCRYKFCGGFLNNIGNDDYYALCRDIIIPFIGISPPGFTCEIFANSINDRTTGSGCNSVHLKYIDSNGDVKDDIVNLDNETNEANSDIREIIEFKCKTFGSLGYNDGFITLQFDNGLFNTIIPANFNNSMPFGIEVPQNGHTLLKKITITSVENSNPDIDLEVKILLIEYRGGNVLFTYRTLFLQRCKYLESVTFDLSEIPPIEGSGLSNVNFGIYPIAKAIGSSSTAAQVFLSAINIDQ